MSEKKCPYCAELIKTEAIRCKHCHADLSPKVARSPDANRPTPIPVEIVKEKKTKWWLWVPIGAVVAFVGYGFTIPEHEAEARAAYNTCRDMYAKGQVASLYECDRLQSEILAKGKKP